MSQQEKWEFLSLQVETLERELQVKSALSEEALRAEIDLNARVEQMEEDYKDEQNTTFAVTADMARQYKALQEELITKINSLETQLTEQKEELDITTHELKDLIKDKNADIGHRDKQIRELNERMNEMSTEFAGMLNDTLELMKNRIGNTLDNEAEEDAAKPDFVQRMLQDYSEKAYNAVSVSRASAVADRAGAAEASAPQ